MTPTHLMLALLASMVDRDLRAPAVVRLRELKLITTELYDDHGKQRERVVVMPLGKRVEKELSKVFSLYCPQQPEKKP